MEEEAAPDLLGLAPDDAARACYARGLDLAIEDNWAMSWWGWDQPGVRVAEQWPSPGERLTSTTVMVRVEFTPRPDGAGVREPRRPTPPQPRAAALDPQELDGALGD